MRQIEQGRIPASMLNGRYPLPFAPRPRPVRLNLDVAREVLSWAEAGLDRKLAEADWRGDGWIVVVDDAAEEANGIIARAKDAGDRATMQWWGYTLLHLSVQMKRYAERLGLDLADLEQAYFDYVNDKYRRPEMLLTMHCRGGALRVDFAAPSLADLENYC